MSETTLEHIEELTALARHSRRTHTAEAQRAFALAASVFIVEVESSIGSLQVKVWATKKLREELGGLAK